MEAELYYWKALGKLFGSRRISLFTVHTICIHTPDFPRKVRTLERYVGAKLAMCIQDRLVIAMCSVQGGCSEVQLCDRQDINFRRKKERWIHFSCVIDWTSISEEKERGGRVFLFPAALPSIAALFPILYKFLYTYVAFHQLITVSKKGISRKANYHLGGRVA